MNYLRIFIFLFLVLSISCSKEELPNEDCCPNENCSILNPFSFSSYPAKDGINVSYGLRSIVDGVGKTCYPEELTFSISDDGVGYQEVATVEAKEGTLLIDNLEDGREYYVKLANIHNELDPVASIQKAFAGEIPLPKFIDAPSWGSNGYEDFRLSPLGNELIIRNNANNWFLASLEESNLRNQIAENAFNAQWNPYKATEIAIVEDIRLESISAITSKRLVAIDVNSAARTILHEITNPWDFRYDSLNTELYWIHEFHYSLDGDAIYFMSNKDNKATDLQEKIIYNNIWRLDLQTKDIEPLSDFLSKKIELHDFIEDPKQKGNFYLSGYSFEMEKAAIYYYNTQEQTLSPIHQINERSIIRQVQIDPIGNHLLYTSDRTGENELWSYNLLTNQVKQITSSNTYYPLSRWLHLNWISDNEFMTLVNHDNKNKFGVFSVR